MWCWVLARTHSCTVAILVTGKATAGIEATNFTIDTLSIGAHSCDGCDTVLLQSLAPGDLVDIVDLTGDVTAIGNQGTAVRLAVDVF
jgi:hypothetical protein